MNIKSSITFLFLVFGLFIITTQILSQEKNKIKKTEPSKDSDEPKIIIDSGLGKFDWKGKSDYRKSPTLNRKEATKETEGKTDCPSCGTKDIPILTVTSQRNAIDYDFCEHYIGDSPYLFDIWACSVCGYSNYRKIFNIEMEVDDKNFVKKYLTEQMNKSIKDNYGNLFKDLKNKPLNQKVIPPIVKIKNFVSYIEHLNSLNEKWKAFYYVRAVYTIRNQFALTFNSASLNMAIIEISKQTDLQVKVSEKDKRMPYVSAYYLNFYLSILENYKESTKERIVLHLLIAQCFERLGYYTETKNHLNKALELSNKTQNINDVMKEINELLELLEFEKQFAQKAISSMKDALETKTDYGANLTAIIYLIGELSRRFENYQDAYLFLSACKRIYPKESPIYPWIEEHLKRKELKNDAFLLLTPPAYLKDIVISETNKQEK